MELKSCPFCGSEEIKKTDLCIRDQEGNPYHYLAVCPQCGLMQTPCDTEDECISKWNRRPTEEAQEKQNAALRERVCELEGFLKKIKYYLYRENDEKGRGAAVKLLYAYKDMGDLQEYNFEFFQTIDILASQANRLIKNAEQALKGGE